MTIHRSNIGKLQLALGTFAIVLGAACGDDDASGSKDEDAGDDSSQTTDEEPVTDPGDDEPDDQDAKDAGATTELDASRGTADAGQGSTGSADAGPQAKPVYMIQTAIYSPDTTLNYVTLSNKFDLSISPERLDTAREFAGYTGVEAIDGVVYAADGSAPFIRKYQINEDLSWKELGKLNFSNYPMDEFNYMNFYFQAIKDPENVYFFYGTDKTSRVHWNPKTWKIIGAHTDTKMPKPPAGWVINNGGNRTGIRNYRGPVVQPFNTYNEETDTYGDKSWLAVYDERSHEEKALIEVPCPGMMQGTMDENGDMYFSTTYSFPTAALYGKGPAPCIVKVKHDGTLDKSFAANDLKAWTGGFYGVNFRYLKNGMAVANVLHHDRLGAAFTGEVDDAVVKKITEDPTLWDLHLIDLNAGTSKVVSEGFKPEHDLNWYTLYMQVENRIFIVVQLDSKTTQSAIYELDLTAAKVKYMADAEGDIWTVQRVR